MKALRALALCILTLTSGAALGADTKVELKGTHLCCPQCVRAVDAILKKVDGCPERVARRPGR
jgi:hypothetical protein